MLWEVVCGDTAAQEAERLGIVRRGQAGVARLTPKSGFKGKFIRVHGTIQCHGCRTHIPFEEEFWIGLFGGGSEVVCHSCGNRLSIGQSSKTLGGAEVLFIYVMPMTEQYGQRLDPIELSVTQIDGEDVGATKQRGTTAAEYREGQMVSCEKCGKQVRVQFQKKGTIAIADPQALQTTALRCQDCGFITCYSCASASVQLMLVCPSCKGLGGPSFFPG